MYRVFCESYPNYINNYAGAESEYRYKIAKPLELITNLEKYEEEKQKESIDYKNISDLLVYMSKNIERYPKFKAFLWTIEARELRGKHFGVTPIEQLEEQAKLVNMFLCLLYWEEATN